MWVVEPKTGQPLIIGILTNGPDHDTPYDDTWTGEPHCFTPSIDPWLAGNMPGVLHMMAFGKAVVWGM